MARQTYRVNARRTGKWWALDVADVPDARAMTRHLDQAETEIRPVLAGVLDVAPDNLDFEVVADMASAALDEARQAQEAYATAKAARDAALPAAVAELKTAGLSDRDIAPLLGVSHQYVSKIRTGERLGRQP